MNKNNTETNKTDIQLLCEFMLAEGLADRDDFDKESWERHLISCNGNAEKAGYAYIIEKVKTLCKYGGLCTCPECGSLVKFSRLTSENILSIPFPMLVEYGWVCVKCRKTFGSASRPEDADQPTPSVYPIVPDDITFGTDNPLEHVTLPYESSVCKKFFFKEHPSKLLIDSKGLHFTDLLDPNYSFNLSKLQLKQARFKKLYDSMVIYANAARYDIELNSKHLENKYDEIIAAICLVIESK